MRSAAATAPSGQLRAISGSMAKLAAGALVWGVGASGFVVPAPALSVRANLAVPSSTPLCMTTSEDRPVSRRDLLGATVAAVLGGVALAARPQEASAGVKRIKGGGPVVTLDSGVTYQEFTIGDGPTPQKGDRVAVHYSLFYKGLEVESSRDSQGLAARPLGFDFGTPAGPGSVPSGLEEVVKGMQVGGRRKATLPPASAFGKTGRPPFIPPGATVQIDVSLWSVKPSGRNPNITLPGSSTVF